MAVGDGTGSRGWLLSVRGPLAIRCHSLRHTIDITLHPPAMVWHSLLNMGKTRGWWGRFVRPYREVSKSLETGYVFMYSPHGILDGSIGINHAFLVTIFDPMFLFQNKTFTHINMIVKPKQRLMALAAWGSLFGALIPVSAQTWTQTGVPDQFVPAVASSADGNKLVAAGLGGGMNGYGTIFTSTNSGATWTSNNLPILVAAWNSVASSADGTKLVAVSGYGAIITSTNGGATWMTNSAPNEGWTSVASSADGNKLVAVAGADAYGSIGNISAICISTNGGATWIQTCAPSNHWVSVASSADGSKLVAAVMVDAALGNPDLIYVSTNSGATWTQISALSNVWTSVASSADGSKLVAACYPAALINQSLTSAGGVYNSTNSGATWISNNVPDWGWQAVASSADGSKLVAGMNTGIIYTSTNSGATWMTNNAPNAAWNSFATSADGSKLIGAAADMSSGSGIFTSQTIPTPQLNITPLNDNLVLSWIVPSTNFVLQQSADLSSWTDVTNPPALNLTNLQDKVVLSSTNGSGFYRLKTP